MRLAGAIALVLTGALTARGGDGAIYGKIAVEKRDVEGSALHEIRATLHAAVPPEAILTTLWKHDQYLEFIPYMKHLEVLRDDGDTRIVYEQLAAPLVKDRDLTLRVHRSIDPATGVCEFTSTAVPDEGPPENDDYVRVRTSTSRWQLVPSPDGGTDVTYTIRADGGGFTPDWMVNIAQRSAVPKLLRAVVARTVRDAR